ncbi:MAG TPA: asparagine synthase (glutamine-hydrolyzing), partial [Planctomycetota bacterium]|nr:asparagine synthase (glutamine-hydrolyzing) [Planctomycetota bacterium]
LMNGQFAFAAWDEAKRELTLARDRLGQKPLFYHHDDARIVFASSLAALLEADGVVREIDPVALDLYLAFGYVPAPRTLFRAVRKLAPASTLILRDGKFDEERYWRLPADDGTRDDASLRDRMTDAVRRRLVSDVPLGAWLSGGIDSSIIVALMSELTDAPVKTFAIGFGEPLYDELEYARAVADRFGTDHHEFTVAPRAAEVIEKLVPLFGEPFADSSAIPTWYLSRETRAHVKVALSGDGGDELFGGYDRYRAMMLAERVGRWPRFLRKLAASLAGSPGEQRSMRHRMRRFLDAAGDDPVERYLAWMGLFPASMRERLLAGPMTDTCAEDYLREAFARNPAGTPADRAMRVDLVTYLPGDPLVKTDVASLAFGLEVRCPFLDPELVALAQRIPMKQKLSLFTGKRILRKTFRDRLPAKVRKRRKMGFGVPLGRWFRGELRGMLNDVLLSQRARERGVLKPHAVQGLIEEHQAGHADHSARLYALLFLELWFREFID